MLEQARPSAIPKRPDALFCAWAFVLFALLRVAAAQDAGELALRPGETVPQPRQRGLNEVEAVPESLVACPACGYSVAVPEVDTLMRRVPGQAGDPPRWRPHAASRDADLCPYPGQGKVFWRADIVICPDCGFAAADFASPLPPATAAWAMERLRPNLRAAQFALLGNRAAEMDDDAIIAFFNRQSEIPDVIRTEHARVYVLSAAFPKLAKAEASWTAAWAARQAVVAPPRGTFFARRRAAVDEALAKVKRSRTGLAGEVAAVRHLLGKTRAGKDRLAAADRFAARLLLAGLRLRMGHAGAAEKELDALLAAARERFVHPEQDPLWQAVAPRASRSYRLSELENVRLEMERELRHRLELLQSERELLAAAAQFIREAMVEGELAGRPEEALFHGYLGGEFIRRTGNLPLAAEWFKNVLNLAAAESAVARAATLQLEMVRDSADDNVNLLSALGQDGDVFEKLREILHPQ